MAQQIEQWRLDLLDRLAQGIEVVVGPQGQVVVHDSVNLELSPVLVAGGVIGWGPDALIPDLDCVAGGLERGTPDRLNHRGRISDHQPQSWETSIRVPQGRPTGEVCVQADYSGLLRARGFIGALASSTESDSDLVISDPSAWDVAELIK